MADDGLDKYRKEYNKNAPWKSNGSKLHCAGQVCDGIRLQEKISRKPENYFARVGADLIAHFSVWGHAA